MTTEDKPAVFDRLLAPVFTLCAVYSGDEVLVPPEVHTPGRGMTPIGRNVEGGISLGRDRRASRLHATLHGGPAGTLRIVDEGSRNGTLVNGRRVSEALLADGDVINIGDSYLVARARPRDLRDALVPSLLGISPVMCAARAALAEAGPTTATVLLLAESGCGKEVAARALHELGRRGGPFVAVNCSAIPEGLAESQLFGQVAGSFTGAVARPGLFHAAHGGTLFLDEVGDLPPAIQPKFLRVLDERAVLPVGATVPVPVDVRIVAATNRDLAAGIAEQRFRGDLYARLAQLEVRLRPLRDRREDVLLLLHHALGEGARPITPRLAEALLLHSWPFNVREVLAVAQQLRIRAAGAGAGVGASAGMGAEPFDLPFVADRLGPDPAAAPADSEAVAVAAVSGAAATDGDDDDGGAAAPDRAGLEALLRAHRGVVSEVARAVRRSRKQVYRWIAGHGLDVKRYRGDGAE